MFKKKKEENSTNFTKLYIRLSSLYNSVDTSKCDIYSSNRVESFEVETYLNNNKSFMFTFKSNNGLIEFRISNSTEQEYKPYKISYINRATKWMFEIYSSPTYTVVQPNLGTKLTARDIDLALFEIENFIDSIVQTNKSNFATHLKELKKLENMDFTEED